MAQLLEGSGELELTVQEVAAVQALNMATHEEANEELLAMISDPQAATGESVAEVAPNRPFPNVLYTKAGKKLQMSPANLAEVIQQSDAAMGEPVVFSSPDEVRPPTMPNKGVQGEVELGKKESPRAKEAKKDKTKEKEKEPKKKKDKEGPLTNEELAYARELADELRPLLARMTPEKQRATLGRLDLHQMS